MSDFKKQVVSSSKWAFINQFVTQVVRLTVSVYLMRLLAPESFGVFMKVLSIIGISEVLVGLRLGGGLVQSKEATKEQISTIFWISIIVGVLLAIIVFYSGGLIANFYDDPQLASITRLLSFVIIIMGVGYVPRALLTKHLEFKKIFYANLIAIIISSIAGIWLALNHYGYWSLVWQWAAFNSVVSISFIILSRLNISLSFNRMGIIRMWNFSKKILIDDSLNYGARNLDNILVGKFLGAEQLGFYSRAYGLMLIPIQNFVSIIRGVLFPAFSIIQDNKTQINNVFYLSSQSISFILQPLFLFTIIYTDELVQVVLGLHWMPISPILKVFLILALVQSHTTLISSIFLSLGRTDIILRISYITKPFIFAAMYFSVQYGLMPLVLSIVILNSITSLISLHYGLKLINSNILDYIISHSPLFLVNIIIYGLCFIQYYFFPIVEYNILSLSLILGLSLTIYLIIFERMKLKFYTELKAQIFSIF